MFSAKIEFGRPFVDDFSLHADFVDTLAITQASEARPFHEGKRKLTWLNEGHASLFSFPVSAPFLSHLRFSFLVTLTWVPIYIILIEPVVSLARSSQKRDR